jgi:hypothetical protein
VSNVARVSGLSILAHLIFFYHFRKLYKYTLDISGRARMEWYRDYERDKVRTTWRRIRALVPDDRED